MEGGSLSGRDRPDLSGLLGAVLAADEPAAELLARYVRDPSDLTPGERAQVEEYQARAPFARAQIQAIRRFTESQDSSPRPRAASSVVERIRERIRERVGSVLSRPLLWVPAGAAAASALAWVLLTGGPDVAPDPASRTLARSQTSASPEPSTPGGPDRPTAGPGSTSAPSARPAPPESSSPVGPDAPGAPTPVEPAPEPPRVPAVPSRALAAAEPVAPPSPTPEGPGADSSDTDAIELSAGVIVAQLLRVDRAGDSPKIDLDVPFDPETDEPTPAGQQVLRQLALALRDERLSQDRFVLEVHTDDRGPADENQRASERRARAAELYLRSQVDLPEARLRSVGRGETEPVVPGSSDAVRAINRRLTLRRLGAE